MSLQDMSAADLAAVMNNDGNGFGNGNGWWIILLFLFLGWGNRGYGNNGGGAGNVGGDMIYPWMNQAQAIWTGFSQIQQDLCNGFANVTGAITTGFAQAEAAATTRQMANMQQMFGLSQQLAECCCENRLATANLQADIAREACATRQVVNDGVQTLLMRDYQNQIDAERRENEHLRQENNMLALQASQTAQNAFIQQGFANEVDALYNRLNACPVPTTPVYGRTPIFTCGGCGCNGNTGFIG